MAGLAGMVAKDLRRRLRAPVGLVVLLIFPLAFAGMVGVSFGPSSGSGGTGLPRIQVLVVDHDQELLSNALENAAGNEEFSKFFQLTYLEDEAEARARMESGEASALLVLPESLTDDLLDLKPVTLQLVKNPAESILPQVAEESLEVLAVMLDTAVRILGEPVKTIITSFEDADGAETAELPSDAVLTGLTLQLAGRVRPLTRYVFPPVLTFETVAEDEVGIPRLLAAGPTDEMADLKAAAVAAAGGEPADEDTDGGGDFNIFAVLLPMVTLMSILFMGDNGMRDLLSEQKAGTLTRQFASPAGVSRVLAAKVLFTLLLCAAAMVILAVAGLALGWLPREVSLGGAALQVAAIALAATGLSTFVYGFARTDRTASTIHSAAVVSMSLVGGSMVPVSQMPAFLKSLAPYTINYWGIRGFNELLSDGAGLAGVVTEAGVLAAIGAAGLLVGWRRLAGRYGRAGAAS